MSENRRIQFIIRRSKPVTKIVASAAILLSIAALVTLGLTQRSIQAETDAMAAEAFRLQQENDQLQDKIDAFGNVKSVEQIAEDELDLVDPDTIIIETD